jgi:hypothetical protein
MVVSCDDASIAVVKALNALYGPISPTSRLLGYQQVPNSKIDLSRSASRTLGVSKAQLKELFRRKTRGKQGARWIS